jgi:hypothetical protein
MAVGGGGDSLLWIGEMGKFLTGCGNSSFNAWLSVLSEGLQEGC